MDVGEAEVAAAVAVGELFVVDAHLVPGCRADPQRVFVGPNRTIARS